METKICSKCGIEKPVNEFQFRKDTGKYRNMCIKCNYLQRKDYKDKYYQEHKDEYKKYREKNKEHLKEYFKNNYLKKKAEKLARRKKFYEEHKVELLQRQKEYRENNKEIIKIRKRNDHYKYYVNGSLYKLKQQYRNILNKAFTRFGYTKKTRAYKILGCDYETFMKHLKHTFYQNYGYEWDGKEVVHIDHIIPLATIENEDDLLRLNHYTNLQLLKEKDNLEKSDKLDWKLKKEEE